MTVHRTHRKHPSRFRRFVRVTGRLLARFLGPVAGSIRGQVNWVELGRIALVAGLGALSSGGSAGVLIAVLKATADHTGDITTSAGLASVVSALCLFTVEYLRRLRHGV